MNMTEGTFLNSLDEFMQKPIKSGQSLILKDDS